MYEDKTTLDLRTSVKSKQKNVDRINKHIFDLLSQDKEVPNYIIQTFQSEVTSLTIAYNLYLMRLQSVITND